MSSKLTARRRNPGTPKVCKSKPPPIPEPPSQPICDPTTTFKVQVDATWTTDGTPYHWSAIYDLTWDPIGLNWTGAALSDPYDSFASLTPNPGTCAALTLDLWVTNHEDGQAHATSFPIPCTATTPLTWTFPPWSFLDPPDATVIAQLTANAP